MDWDTFKKLPGNMLSVRVRLPGWGSGSTISAADWRTLCEFVGKNWSSLQEETSCLESKEPGKFIITNDDMGSPLGTFSAFFKWEGVDVLEAFCLHVENKSDETSSSGASDVVSLRCSTLPIFEIGEY